PERKESGKIHPTRPEQNRRYHQHHAEKSPRLPLGRRGLGAGTQKPPLALPPLSLLTPPCRSFFFLPIPVALYFTNRDFFSHVLRSDQLPRPAGIGQKDRPPGLEAGRQIEDALVGRAAEAKLQTLL